MSEHMALENLTVLDLTRVLAGPFCTMMLADMGANVIKIEVPKGGDDTRSYPPFRAKNLNGERESVYFANINRNKKGITLNLKAPEGKEIFKELVKKADIVVENYRPGVMDKLGLGYDVLKEINPRIIYAAVSGFGCYGPYHLRPGYDILAQAMGGMMSITGSKGGEPTRAGSALGDILGGLHVTIGILAAVNARTITGKGQRVDVSLMDSMIAATENTALKYIETGNIPAPMGNRYAAVSPYMGKGLSSIVATGVMFIFAILFFSTCSDAGVFDPIINRILKFTGEDPVKVCIGTFLIGCICHLDGSGATTFLIAIPACMPLFQKLKMNLWVEATIVALAAGIMNVMPWGGPTVRAAAAMSGLGYEVTGSELWVGIMPAWIAGLVTCLLVAAFLGKKEAKRIAAGIPAQEVTGLTEAKTTNTSNELARSGWRWYFNVALILVILYILVTNRLSPAVTFMIGYCVLLIVNYPSVDLQHKIINSHAQAAFLMVSIVFAAGAFTGVVKNSGMLASMTDALVSIIPTSMGTFIAPIVGLFSVPLSLLFDPDSYYYGVMPVIANAVSAMGGNALAVAKASIMGQMTLGFPLSPLTGATFLLLGLSGQDLGDHQKHTLPYAWFASAIMVAVGCVACGLLF